MTLDRISQNNRNSIFFLTLLLGLTLVIGYVIFLPFFHALAYAMILATACYPVQSRVRRYIHARGSAAFISTGILCLLVVIPLVIVFNLAAGEAVAVAREIQARSASQGGLVPFIARGIDRGVQFLSKYVDLSRVDIQGHLQAKAKGIGENLLPTIGGVLQNLVGFILNLVIMLMAVYVMLRDGDRIVSAALRLLPLTERKARRLLQILKDNVVANVQGIFAVGSAQGLATGLTLAALGVPQASLLGIAAAISSVIPIFGTALVWGPVAIQLLLTHHVVKGLILLGLGAGVIGQLDNVIRPLIVGRKVQANALVIMIAMLGGIHAYGFLGLFIGPVVVALIVAIGKMLHEEISESEGAYTGPNSEL